VLHLSPETEALIRAKAAADKTTPDDLLRRMLQGTGVESSQKKPDIERMKAIARRTAALPILDARTAKEIADEAWGL